MKKKTNTEMLGHVAAGCNFEETDPFFLKDKENRARE